MAMHLDNGVPMGVLSDQLKSVIDRMREINEREAQATREHLDAMNAHLKRLGKTIDELSDD